MDLPLADEIREARRLAEDSRDAAIHSQRVLSTLASIDVLQRQAYGLDAEEVVVPGDELIGHLAWRWEQLADLAVVGPRPMQPLGVRLYLRRQQLEAAQMLLAPLANEAQRRGDVLADLRHRQQHLLEDPKYRDDMLELSAVANERTEVGYRLTPITNRLNSLRPAQSVVATFIERIDWVTREKLHFPGGTEWRAAMVARDLGAALGAVLDQYGLEMQRPLPITVPEGPDPDPERSAELMAQVTRLRDALVTLAWTLWNEQTKIAAEAAVLQQRYDELGQQLQDRMG